MQGHSLPQALRRIRERNHRRTGRDQERDEQRASRQKDFAEDTPTSADELHGTDYQRVALPAPQETSDHEAVEALRFLLRLASGLFACGAETGRIREYLIAISAVWRMENVEVLFGTRTLQLQYAPPGRRPLLMAANLPPEDGWNVGNMVRLSQLADRTVLEGTALEQAESELDAILGGRGARPMWTQLAGACLVVAMMSMVIGGGFVSAVFAALGALIWVVGGVLLNRFGLPPFFNTAIVSAALGVLVVWLYKSGVTDAKESAAVLAGNLAIMLPVLTVLSAAQDGIRGFRGLALDRLLSIVLNTGASLAALVGVAFVAPSLQEAVHGTAFTLLPWWGSFAIWVIASFACCTMLGAPWRLYPFAIGCAILTGYIQTTLLSKVGMAPAFATFVATTALGLAAAVLGGMSKLPPRGIALPAIAGSVLPTPQIYTTLIAWNTGSSQALPELGTLLLVTGAIGCGVVLGLIVGRGAVHRYWDSRHPADPTDGQPPQMLNVGAGGAGMTSSGGGDPSRPD